MEFLFCTDKEHTNNSYIYFALIRNRYEVIVLTDEKSRTRMKKRVIAKLRVTVTVRNKIVLLEARDHPILMIIELTRT